MQKRQDEWLASIIATFDPFQPRRVTMIIRVQDAPRGKP